MKKGVTLVEVMVALLIIGIVAILTLPALITKSRQKALDNAKKNFMSTVIPALRTYLVNEGFDDISASPLIKKDDTSDDVAQEQITEFSKNYLKLKTSCLSGRSTRNCFSTQYWDEDKRSLGSWNNKQGYVIRNGFVYYLSPFIYEDGAGQKYAKLFVDINGKSGPNVKSKDLFLFYVYTNLQMSDKSDTIKTTETPPNI